MVKRWWQKSIYSDGRAQPPFELEEATPANLGAAAATHAGAHQTGGSDPLAGQSIPGLTPADDVAFDIVTATEFRRAGGTDQQILLASGASDLKTRGVESTGLYSWAPPCISIASPTTFTIQAVYGQIVDTTTTPGIQVITQVAYPGAVGVTVTHLASAPTSYVMVSAAGVLTQQTTIPTAQERREKIFLGILVHSAFTALTAIDVQPDICASPISQMRDLWGAIRYVNDGVIPYPNGANLSINIAGGNFHGLGLNWAVNPKDPMIRDVGPFVAPNFKYRLRAGGTLSIVALVDPTHWDNAGGYTVLAGGANTSTNQRVYISPAGEIVFQYGQTVYASLSDAIANASTEAFVTAPAVAENLQLIGTLSVRKGATNLSILTDARFLIASKFGELSSGGAGASTATLQSAYDNSVIPQILTNATNGALTIKRGSAGDTDNVIAVQNGAGTQAASITGSGSITGTTIVKSGGTSAQILLANGGVISTTTWQPLEDQRLSTTNGPTFAALTVGAGKIANWLGFATATWMGVPAFNGATAALTAGVVASATGGLSLFAQSGQEVGLWAGGTKMLSVSTGGTDASSGPIKIAGVTAISSARAFDGTGLKLTGQTANALAKFDPSGNIGSAGVTESAGVLTGSGFVKSGATALQVLMGNGSVNTRVSYGESDLFFGSGLAGSTADLLGGNVIKGTRTIPVNVLAVGDSIKMVWTGKKDAIKITTDPLSAYIYAEAGFIAVTLAPTMPVAATNVRIAIEANYTLLSIDATNHNFVIDGMISLFDILTGLPIAQASRYSFIWSITNGGNLIPGLGISWTNTSTALQQHTCRIFKESI